MSFKGEKEKKVVLVGTYRAGQLERWPGYYNYPLAAGDAVDAGAAKKVNEIWLFNGARDGRHFAAEFVGTFTRAELVRDWGYPAKGAAHGERYLLYRIRSTYEPANTPDALAEEVERVIVRAADFAKRSPKIARAIKAYLESSDRNDTGLRTDFRRFSCRCRTRPCASASRACRWSSCFFMENQEIGISANRLMICR